MEESNDASCTRKTASQRILNNSPAVEATACSDHQAVRRRCQTLFIFLLVFIDSIEICMKNSRLLRGIRFQADSRNQQTSSTLYFGYRNTNVMAQELAKFLLLFLYLLKSNVVVCGTQNCYKALADCNNDDSCGNKLKVYVTECAEIVDTYRIKTNESMYPCSNSCVKAIRSLRQTARGKALWKCNCVFDAHCMALKTRTEKCLAIENGTYRKKVGCSYAHYKCMKDSKCKVAQLDFLTKCAKLFTLTECTDQCLCSQKRLFGLPVGKPLLNCECDGSDELYCLGLRAHADHMNCSWKKRRRTRNKLKRRRCKRNCNKKKKKGEKCGRRDKSKKKD